MNRRREGVFLNGKVQLQLTMTILPIWWLLSVDTNKPLSVKVVNGKSRPRGKDPIDWLWLPNTASCDRVVENSRVVSLLFKLTFPHKCETFVL